MALYYMHKCHSFKVTYSIVGGNGMDHFQIDNATGWVQTKGNNLDYERERVYVLRIMAADHGTPPQRSNQEYRIAVQDVNEFQPQFVRKSYEFSVRGNATIGTKVGSVRPARIFLLFVIKSYSTPAGSESSCCIFIASFVDKLICINMVEKYVYVFIKAKALFVPVIFKMLL